MALEMVCVGLKSDEVSKESLGLHRAELGKSFNAEL